MASAEQKELMQQFQEHTGWEFVGKDRVKATDPAGFVEQWESNIKWIEDSTNLAESMISV